MKRQNYAHQTVTLGEKYLESCRNHSIIHEMFGQILILGNSSLADLAYRCTGGSELAYFLRLRSTGAHVYHVAGSAHPESGGKCLWPSSCGDSLLRSLNYLILSALIKQPSHYNLAFHVDFPIGREQADL